MAQASIDQPIAWQPPAGRRPMSLLLQALRQIDSKESACIVPAHVPSTAPAIAAPVTVELSSSKETPPCDLDCRANLAGPAEQQLAQRVRDYLRTSDRILAFATAEPTVAAGQLAGSLALGLARQDALVLLVEKAELAPYKLFAGLPIDLADVVAGHVAFHEAAAGTADPHVQVLRIKSDLRLTAMELAGVWTKMRDQFQYVVLDTGGFDEASAAALLTTCDAAFLVARIGQNSRRQIQRRIELLRKIGVDLRACLVGES